MYDMFHAVPMMGRALAEDVSAVELRHDMGMTWQGFGEKRRILRKKARRKTIAPAACGQKHGEGRCLYAGSDCLPAGVGTMG